MVRGRGVATGRGMQGALPGTHPSCRQNENHAYSFQQF